MKSDQIPRRAISVPLAVLTILTLLPCVSLAQYFPLIRKFSLWGTMQPVEKFTFFNGWADGFFTARPNGAALMQCLSGIPYEQSIAMIDKYYKDHPETWSNAITAEIVQAVTVKGGPCEERYPTGTSPK